MFSDFSGILRQILSFTKKAFVTTTFADDYVAQGKAFQIQRRITLTSQQTLYLVLDTTALIASNKKLVNQEEVVTVLDFGLVIYET